jgi:hypothetical protein
MQGPNNREKLKQIQLQKSSLEVLKGKELGDTNLQKHKSNKIIRRKKNKDKNKMFTSLYVNWPNSRMSEIQSAQHLPQPS